MSEKSQKKSSSPLCLFHSLFPVLYWNTSLSYCFSSYPHGSHTSNYLSVPCARVFQHTAYISPLPLPDSLCCLLCASLSSFPSHCLIPQFLTLFVPSLLLLFWIPAYALSAPVWSDCRSVTCLSFSKDFSLFTSTTVCCLSLCIGIDSVWFQVKCALLAWKFKMKQHAKASKYFFCRVHKTNRK